VSRGRWQRTSSRITTYSGSTYAAAAAAAALFRAEFKKPEKWTAPYSMYTPGWWKLFYPGAEPMN
jgi:hypothetical protein